MGKWVSRQVMAGLAILALMTTAVAADSFDDWIENVRTTSSSENVQPKQFYKPGMSIKSPRHKKSSSKLAKGRRAEELLDVTTDGTVGKGALSDIQPFGYVDGAAAASKSTPKKITVAKDGSGNFKTVQAAVNSIPKSNSRRVIIYVKPGMYREKVKIDADWITLQGSGPRLTEIQWGDTASKAGSTFKSASVAVNGDHFTAKDISFRNTAPAPQGGAVGKQAVALRISGDYGAFINVNFYGAQDTLYDQKGRHYFYRCYIEGSIDFIFGNGRSFYFQCRLHSIATPHGSLTAQKRESTSENTGFSFVRCTVTGTGNIYLGRAWGPASRVVFSQTYIDNIILPEGWFDWGDSSRQKTVFYAEYKCYGPGANRKGRVPWSRVLTDSQAKPFLHTGFINGEQWLNQI